MENEVRTKSASLDGKSQGETCNPSENDPIETKSLKYPNITYAIESYARLVERHEIEPSIYDKEKGPENFVNKIQHQISESSVNEIQDKISKSSANEIQEKICDSSVNEKQVNIPEFAVNEMNNEMFEPQDADFLLPKGTCESETGEVDVENPANFLEKLKEIEEKVSVGKGKEENIIECETTCDFIDDEIVNLDDDQNKFDDNIKRQEFCNDIAFNDFPRVVERRHKKDTEELQQLNDIVSNANYNDDDDIEEIPRDDEFYHPSPKILEFLADDLEMENMNDLDLDPVKAWERIKSLKYFPSTEVLNKQSKNDFLGKTFLTD